MASTRDSDEWIEWVERGWPLRPDGTSDSSAASELCVFAASTGLAGLSPGLIEEVFAPLGGAWRALGVTPAEAGGWPAALPGAVALRTSELLERELGRGLVLALIERRREPGGRGFTRCVWFVLPRSWSTELDANKIAAACDLLLRHRGEAVGVGGAAAARCVVPRRGFAVAQLRRSARGLEPVVPATPSELLAGLVEFGLARAADDLELDRLLRGGLAVLCSPSCVDEFELAIVASEGLLPRGWVAPIPPIIGIAERAGSSGIRAKPTSSARHHSQPLRAETREPVVEERPRADDASRMQTPAMVLLAAILLFQLVQVALLGILLGRVHERVGVLETAGMKRQSPRHADERGSATELESSGRFLLVPRADEPGLAALVVDQQALLDWRRGPTAVEQEALSELADEDSRLIMIGYARTDVCEAALELARDLADRSRGLLPEGWDPAATLVIGQPDSDSLPFSGSQQLPRAGVIVLRERDAEAWRALDGRCPARPVDLQRD